MNGIIEEYIEVQAANSIIKVIGVGGGGGNAVNYMYKQGIKDVTFAICNTDRQALDNSPIPTKILLGTGLGAGNIPQVACDAAETSKERIKNVLDDGTKMVFITAGMGGGTGTGAAPVVAEVAKSLGILTVGIVTIPFGFEGRAKIFQALEGIARISDNVDAILLINNDKLKDIYPDLDFLNAFGKSDNVVAAAAKGIAEIVTINGYINVDFADVNTVMRNGGVAIMNSGYASGENRISKAIEDALNSPLLNNNDIHNSKKILLSFYCSSSHAIKMDETKEIDAFMSKMGDDIIVKWGVTVDESLGEDVKVTIIATGANMSVIPEEYREDIKRREEARRNGGSNGDVVVEPSKEVNKMKDEWVREFYPEMSPIVEKPALTLDMLQKDPDLLDEMDKTPAYRRIIKQ